MDSFSPLPTPTGSFGVKTGTTHRTRMVLFSYSPTVAPFPADKTLIRDTEEGPGPRTEGNPTSCQSLCAAVPRRHSLLLVISHPLYGLCLIFGGICMENLPSWKHKSGARGIKRTFVRLLYFLFFFIDQMMEEVNLSFSLQVLSCQHLKTLFIPTAGPCCNKLCRREGLNWIYPVVI